MVPDLGGVVEDPRFGRIAGGFFDDGLQVLVGQVRPRDQFAQVFHIGPVVLAVMELQGVGADHGRQGVFGIGQFG